MKKLEGKTIIVTGGNTGIGLAISKKIVSEGGTVIILSRNPNKKILTELNKINKSNHIIKNLDVSKQFQVEDLLKNLKDIYGTIDGLVNCAGIYGPIGKTNFDNQIIQDFKTAIEVNFLGTLYMTNFFIKLFKSDKKLKIVNFAGGGAANAFPNFSAYATSKVAIVRLTENLSIEFKDDNIEINSVAPGFVVTQLHEKTLNAGPENAGNEFYKKTKQQIENGATPPEIPANLTLFLLSDESDGITGKFISAPWDSWENKDFQELLKNDKDFATIRRIDNKQFFKK